MNTLLAAARFAAATLLLPVLTAQHALAWGAEGHRLINRLAVANLPSEVPAFLRNGASLDAIEYLGPEPDRWRNAAEAELNGAQAPEHFIDLEWADLLGPLPKRRYDFVRALAKAQPAHPDLKMTPESVGLQPYVTEEVYERLKAAMREFRTLSAANQDTAPVELAIRFYAGWLGHYVADGAMPLHTSFQYNGWVGANPNHYTTEHHIHSQFESAFVKANIKPADVAPLVAASAPHLVSDEWTGYLDYLRHSNTLVEKTYQLDRAEGFVEAGTTEAKQFTEERLAAGAIELRDMIYTAWVRSADPVKEYREEAPQTKKLTATP